MTQVWESIDQVEKDRVAKLEIFDEFEEWNLLMSHYCLVVAKRGLVRA
jgi:hypothetical protein